MIGDMKQEILDDTHSLVDSDSVYRKILSSARYHRDKRLWYSERELRLPLIQGVDAYGVAEGLPENCAEIVGRNLWILIGGSDDQRQPCVRATSGEMDYEKQIGTSQSQPEIWDFHARKLRFLPVPISSTDIVVGRYVNGIDVPVYRYQSAAYHYFAPDGVTELTAAQLDSFDNDWFDPVGAYHMIRARAMYLLFKETLHDPDSANDWLAQWLEQVGALEDETEQRTAGATEIVSRILD